MDSDESEKAVEVWQSVIERYPRSRVRYSAHIRLGDYFLDRERAHDRARSHFEAVAAEENRDEDQRAEATLKMGICFYEGSNYGKCFKVMREVIEKFPVSQHVNKAYYYIGLGHFQLAHYSRAIAALEKVGTALAEEEGSERSSRPVSGCSSRLKTPTWPFSIPMTRSKFCVATTQGDAETVICHPLGRNVRVVLGSIVSALGKPRPGRRRARRSRR